MGSIIPVCFRYALLLSIGVLLLGCGYSLGVDGKPVGLQINNLAIPIFSSPSTTIGFEADFTKVIRAEFIRHSKTPLVSSDKADALLVGKIKQITTAPISYDSSQITIQGQITTFFLTNARRLTIKLDAKLIDNQSGSIIWSSLNMEEKASFNVTSDPLVNRQNQRIALLEVADRFAKRLFLKTMERF